LDFLLPDVRRLTRRFTESPLPTRIVAHLFVVSLVVAAAATGFTSRPSESGAVAESAGDPAFAGFVSRAFAAPDAQAPSSPEAYSLNALPADLAGALDRGTPAHVPDAPLPTPVAVDPNATPLAAPGSVGETVTADSTPGAPTARVATPAPATGSLVWPVPGGSISQYFHAGHLALDIAAPYGSQVVASQSGIVTSAGWRNNGGGNVVSIDHGNGMTTVYNHLGTLWVSAGAYVAAGQGIGGVGCTGICTGPHVHYEVIVNGVIDNPQRYF
jgi:murein DD-endopeptidase MepM/ murein hydrolase activator NlpD